MRALLLAIAVLASSGCPRRRGAGGDDPPTDPYPGREARLSGVLARELEIEVLEGYELPTLDLGVPATSVSRRVGAVQFGVGTDDVHVGDEGQIERWPLLPVGDGMRLDEVQSKRLEMHLAEDLTTAWVADEVSYRVPGCRAADGSYRTLVVPLRVTGVYVRDGERWVQVLEHVSYPQRVADLVRRPPRKTTVKLRNGMDPRPEVRPAITAMQRALSVAQTPVDRQVLFATDPTALAMWPFEPELRASAIVQAAGLAESFDAVEIELDRYRIGMSPDPTGGVGGGTVAWMAALLRVDARRQVDGVDEVVPLYLRASYVLELRNVDGTLRWQIIQSHVSAPLDDRELLAAIMGEAEVSNEDDPWPWARPCE